MTNLEPTCRYGHGPLEESQNDDNLRFALRSVYKTQEASKQQSITDAPYVFTVRLYRCATCGYVELFDDER
jgi:hypothetical protein